jgi:transposase
VDNDPQAVAAVIDRAGPSPEVAVEATLGWYWLADLLQDMGAGVHLAHPLAMKKFTLERVKNDRKDATDLADLLRLGRLPEAWVAPPPVRECRELVRYRAKLVHLRTGLKAQVHSVLAKQGVRVPMSDLFGTAGSALLDGLELDDGYTIRVDSARSLIRQMEEEIGLLDGHITRTLRHHPGYGAVQTIPGVGPVLGAVFVAEIGDVTRFPSPDRLCSWAGLTPRHRESDRTVRRGHITKQGSRLVRWAAVEAVQRVGRALPKISADKRRIAERRGKGIATAAAARKLLTLVFYALRDHEVRCLQKEAS